MNFPPMAEILDIIKEMDKSSTVPTVYRITKVSARSDGSTSVVCDTEIVYGYDDLCVKMFDLDVSCWEISEGITVEPQITNIGTLYNLVNIHKLRQDRCDIFNVACELTQNYFQNILRKST